MLDLPLPLPFPVLLAMLLPILESIINAYLALDPDSVPAWQALAGSVMQIIIQGDAALIHLYVVINQSGLSLYNHLEREPDVIIKGSLEALWAVCRSRGDTKILFKHSIEITGNIELCQALQKIISHINIDWEEQIAIRLGDRMARRMTAFIRKTANVVQETGDSLQRQISDFLAHEMRVLPKTKEVEQLMDEISALRDATERVEARINRLVAVNRAPY